jgi:hypothetical protein
MDKRVVPGGVDLDDATAAAVTNDDAGSFAARLDLRCDGLPAHTRRAAIEAAAVVLAASGVDVEDVIEGRLAREAWARSGQRLQGPLAEAGAAFSIARMAAASIVLEAQPQLEFELILRESALQ